MEQKVTLKVGGRHFVVCREALKEASLYFKAMFMSGMKESVAEEIEIHDTEPEQLQALIDVAYGKTIEITNENVYDLLRSGFLFQFHEVVKLCTDHLIETLTTRSAVDVWIAGDAFAIKPLCKAALSILLWDFDEFSQSDTSIASCPSELLLALLSRDQINAACENEICEVVRRWLDHNATTCMEEKVVKVLLSVRYSYVDQVVAKSLENCSSEIVKDIVWRTLDVMHRGELADESNLSCQIWDCLKLPRRRRLAVPAVVVAKTLCRDSLENSLAVFIHNNKEESFSFHSQLPALPKALHGYVVCTVGRNTFFLCGEYGIGSGRWNRDVFKWDPSRCFWEKVGTIPNLRRHCKTAVVGTRLYLLGGFGRFRVVLESVDVFDASTGEWETGANVPCPVFSSAVCGTLDSIYLFAGSVHRYDILNNTWYLVKESFPSGPYCAVNRNGNILLIPENLSQCIEFSVTSASFEYTFTLEHMATYACSVGDDVFCVNGEGCSAVVKLDGEVSKVQVDIGGCEKVEGCLIMPYFDLDDIDVERSTERKKCTCAVSR